MQIKETDFIIIKKKNLSVNKTLQAQVTVLVNSTFKEEMTSIDVTKTSQALSANREETLINQFYEARST